MRIDSAQAVSVEVGTVFQVSASEGGVPKMPIVSGFVDADGLEGDIQRNSKFHGGPDRAICLYSLELLNELAAEGHEVFPGATGENLTLADINWASVSPGTRLRIGRTLQLEVTTYARPCKTNARWFSNGNFMRISHTRHPGWARLYARVLAQGHVNPSDAVLLG